MRLALILLLPVLSLCGCCTVRRAQEPPRHFEFGKDTFSFTNGLIWVYEYDANGHWTTHNRIPRPEYWQHCFVMAKACKQFFMNARFDPSLPKAGEDTYRKLVKQVIHSSPRIPLPERVVIPGYANLHAFSVEHAKLLMNTCGSAVESYFQRGHWHVVFPFTRRSQQHTAERLIQEIARGEAPVVHLVRFPQLTINHAVVPFASNDEGNRIAFSIYDPNRPSAPRTIYYEKPSRTFTFPANDYFPGGRVDVYEVYKGLLY